MNTVRSVILDLIGRDNASRAFLSASANAEKAANSFERFGYRTQAMGARIEKSGRTLTKGVTLPLLAVGAVAVKVAADYEKNLNTIAVATGASAQQMNTLNSGIKGIALTTGDSLKSLSQGAYTIQKSTHDAGQTLQILSAAAKGAKAENADLGVVTNGLTSVMASYNLKGDQAVSTMNMLTRGAGLAKTTVQDFTASLSNVVPLASSLGIKLPEVFGAIATMTQHGESSQRASENLNSLISSLAGGSNVMVRTLQQLNIPVNDFQKKIGVRGISGTLQVLLNAMMKNSKGGSVVYDSFKHAALGASSMDTMMGKLTGQALKNAEALRKGTMGVGTYRSEAKKMADGQSNLALQFLGAYQSQTGFNDLLKSGRGNTLTYARALLQATGGITNMGAVLKLLGPDFARTGKASDLFVNNIKSVIDAGKNNNTINGWDKTLKLFTTQWGIFKSHLEVWLVNMGNKLMPTAMSLMDMLKGAFSFLSKIGSALPSGFTKFLLLTAALGPLIVLLGSGIKLFGALYIAAYKLISFGAGSWGINKGLAAMNTGAYQAGSRLSKLNGYVRGFGSALAGLAVGGVIGSFVKRGGVAGWAESILGGGAGGALVGSAFGPLGTAIGGITGAISGGVSHWIAHKNAAKDAAQAEIAWVGQLTAAIETDNGKIGDGTKALLNQQLQAAGVYKKASALGIDGGLVLNAASGDKNATQGVNQQIQVGLGTLQAKYQHYQDVVKQAQLAVQKTAQGSGVGVPFGGQVVDNAGAQKALAAAQAKATAIKKEMDAYKSLASAIAAYNGQSKDALVADRTMLTNFNKARLVTGSFATQLKALSTHASEAKTDQNQLTTSLKVGTIVGDHNRQMLTNLVAAAKKDAENTTAQLAPHIGMKEALAAGAVAYKDNIAQILAAAKAAGFSTKQTATLVKMLQTLANQHPRPTVDVRDKATPAAHNIHDVLNNLGNQHVAPKVTVNDQATATLNNIHDIINNIPTNKTVTVTTVSNSVHDVVNSIPGHAKGTSGLRDGWFTVGERGWELGRKVGSHVEIYPHDQSRKMLGVNKLPGYATGTGHHRHHKKKKKKVVQPRPPASSGIRVGSSGGKQDWIYNGHRYSSLRAAENARASAARSAQKQSASALNSRIANIGQPGSGPQFDINQVGANLVRKQLTAAWAAVSKSGLPAKTIAAMEKQLRRLGTLLRNELSGLRVKIHTTDLKALQNAVKGTGDDMRTALTTLKTDLTNFGTGSKRQMAKLHTLSVSLSSAQDRLTSARTYQSGITTTLSGKFDPTQYGSVEDLLSGMGGQTAQNKAYANELTKLHKESKGNSTLTNFINELAASGQTTTLETLAGASKAQLAQVTRGAGAYNASVSSGGQAATVEKYGESVDRMAAENNRLVVVIEKLVAEIAKSKAVTLDGKHVGHAVAGHVVGSKEMGALFSELESFVSHKRH